MIEPIGEEKFVETFFDLMAEVECGEHFDHSKNSHAEWLRRRIAVYYFSGAQFYAYYHNDIPIGFSTLRIDPGLEGVQCLGQYAELLDIIFLKEFRGKGFGTQLLEHAESVSKTSKVHCMYISTYAKDYRVIGFYGKNGYVPVATMPDVHGPNDEGRIWMRKILNDETSITKP